jgi:dienelactone hydrolase
MTVGDGKWALPGTLSLPVGDGPFPALVLLHGSGAQDRNESIGPNQPFRDLAGGLASRGIVVLRFEKRTKEHSLKWDKKKDTVKEEVLDDAVAAVALVRKTKGIDPKRVFVLGHSLGGRAAPKVAELDPRVAGLVLLAGLSRGIADASREQFDYLASQKNLSRTDKEEFDKLRKAALRLKDAEDGADVPASELPFDIPAVYWISLRDLKPVETAAKLRQPILVLQAERDYQVTMADFELWKKGLAWRTNVEFKSYANLNHLFMDGKGKSTPAEYEEPGHVAKEVIEDVAAWVKKHAG